MKEKERGRKTKNIRIGPIPCSSELPPFCYDTKEIHNIESVSMILMTHLYIIIKKSFFTF